MSKEESINRLQALLGSVALVDDKALQSDIDAVSDIIESAKNSADTIASSEALIAEQAAKINELQSALAEVSDEDNSEELQKLMEANEAQKKQIAELEADITLLNKQLATTEAKKVSSLPTVEHEGSTYQVKFGACVTHEGVMYKFTRDQIVANAPIGSTELTPVSILLAEKASAIAKV